VTPADLSRFQQCRLLVIGDVMLDHFIWGNVRRISPEAPVPVVEVSKEVHYPGGAANVARNVAPFTQHISLMGRVGMDPQAIHLRSLLQGEGVNCETLVVNGDVPTISKARVAARQQQIVRVDREKYLRLTADELTNVEQKLRTATLELDAIVIEDYGKGFVTTELMQVVTTIAKERGILVTVDPSPRNPLPWQGVSLVKPNRLEAFAAAGIEDSHLSVPAEANEEIMKVGETLMQKWDTPMVLVTLGEQGMMLFQRDQAPHHIPTRAREVYDVSGAGDTAIALLTLALASGMNPIASAEVANLASGIVVGKLGTATLTAAELLNAFQED
jgi:D-glycero-beta-D-manno-heptose-7-phosphate kinase